MDTYMKATELAELIGCVPTSLARMRRHLAKAAGPSNRTSAAVHR